MIYLRCFHIYEWKSVSCVQCLFKSDLQLFLSLVEFHSLVCVSFSLNSNIFVFIWRLPELGWFFFLYPFAELKQLKFIHFSNRVVYCMNPIEATSTNVYCFRCEMVFQSRERDSVAWLAG